MSRKILPQTPTADNQHFNTDELIASLHSLQYPAEKIVARIDNGDFLGTEIVNRDLLQLALNSVYSRADSNNCLIIFRVNTETKSFADIEGENNHYVALHFSDTKITYIDPTGEPCHPLVQDLITQKFLQFNFESCRAVLQYTNPQYDDVYVMNGNDYDCGPLVALGADMIRRNFGGIDEIKLDEIQSKRLGQILRKIRKGQASLESRSSEIRVILEDGKIRKIDPAFEEELTEIMGGVAALPQQIAQAQPDSSDGSPDSSDEEYGAKTLMRKVFSRTRGASSKEYKINHSEAEIVSHAEIIAHPNKYFVVNFRGDRLDYFADNAARREYVRTAVDATLARQAPPYKSIAALNIDKIHKDESAESRKEKLEKIGAAKKLQETAFVKTYKTPLYFPKAVRGISPAYGNPVISTSKSPDVTIAYADHPNSEAKLHPKYSEQKKPKHRLIGMEAVFVHEANEYMAREKADIEKLRTEKKIGGKGAVERDNQEIMFANEIEAQNVAGYVPMAYPNLSRKYSDEDKALFGMREKSLQLTRNEPRSLGAAAKRDNLYPLNRALQWKMAEKFAKEKNPDAELLWVDENGQFRKFEQTKIRVTVTAKKAAADSAGTDDEKPTSGRILPTPPNTTTVGSKVTALETKDKDVVR